MKKILILGILITLLLCFIKSTEAITHTFTRYAGNPLPVDLSSGYQNTFQSDIFLDHSNNLRALFAARDLSGRYKIVVGSSSNGIKWSIDKVVASNPSINLFGPRHLTTENGYEIYYGSEEETIKIYRVLCDANFSCEGTGTKIVDTKQGTWNESTAASPFPLRENNKTYVFYEGLKNGNWTIGMSYTDDGQSWTQCPSPFVSEGGGAFIIKKDNKYLMYFHNSKANGIEMMESSDPLDCEMKWNNREYALLKKEPYESMHMVAPSLAEFDQKLHLYYTSRDSTERWALSLATEPLAIIPSPTTTIPQPTFTLTPTPPNMPTISNNIVIIPGMLASWNKEAILHNKIVKQHEWTLPSFVKEYDGIIKTLENHGYQRDNNLFIFSYDWRQSLSKTSKELEQYLQEKIYKNKPDAKITIVGHSLGGLVGRVYTQENSAKVHKLVTVGTPHAGVVQMYSLLQAGEVDRDNSSLWLAAKILLNINKTSLQSDKEMMQEILPVAFDLFPTFNFLRFNASLIPLEKLSIQNSTLQKYNHTLTSITHALTTAFGEKLKNTTPAGYTIEPATALDKLLGRYKDGRPTQSNYENGDYTVLSKSSAVANTHQLKLDGDHSEVISEKSSITQILSSLNISLDPNKVVSGERTILSPSLIFFMHSPAQMEITSSSGKVYSEENGVVFISNPGNGEYKIKAKGITNGEYTITIAYIGEKNDTWHSIKGTITQTPPQSQTDEYLMKLNTQNTSQPLLIKDLDLFAEFISTVEKVEPKNFFLAECLKYIKRAQKNTSNSQKRTILQKAHHELFKAYRFSSKRTDIYPLIEKFEYLYASTLSSYTATDFNQLSRKLIAAQELFTVRVNLIRLLQTRSVNTQPQLILIEEIEKKLKHSEELLQDKNYVQGEIVINSIHELILSI